MAVAQLAVKQEAQSPPPSHPPHWHHPASPLTHDSRDPLRLEERILTLYALNSKGITDDIT